MLVRACLPCLLILACAPAPTQREVGVPAARAPVTAPGAASAAPPPVVPTASAAASSGAPAAETGNETAPNAPVTTTLRFPAFEIESPYLPGGPARPSGVVAASAFDEELARWNVGGSSDPSHPSNRAKYHPAPRVVVSLGATANPKRAEKAEALRLAWLLEARSNGYWPFRSCFEIGLRRRADLSGKVRLRLRVTTRGSVSQARLLSRELPDPDVDACLARVARNLTFKRTPRRALDLDLNVELWPGDAPLPSRVNATGAPLDLAPLAKALSADASPLAACCANATRNDPKLWGRVALSIRTDSSGKVLSAREQESRFPDAGAVACMARALDGVQALPTHGKALEFVWAVRCGEPPTALDVAQANPSER